MRNVKKNLVVELGSKYYAIIRSKSILLSTLHGQNFEIFLHTSFKNNTRSYDLICKKQKKFESFAPSMEIVVLNVF